MQRVLAGLLLVALIFLPVVGLTAQDTSPVHITDAWVRPFITNFGEDPHESDDAHHHQDEHSDQNATESSVLGRGTTAVYFNITNTSTEDITLISANTFAAYKTEIHETVIDSSDVMMMQPLSDGVVIPAGETVAFAPAGKHIMLIGLYSDLPEGGAISLDLTFAHADGETWVLNTAAPALTAAPASTNVVVLDAWTRTTFTSDTADAHSQTHDDHTAESESTEGEENPVAPQSFVDTTAVYMQLLNQGEDDTLLEVRSTVAEIVEIHETLIDANDVMRMQPINALPLPTGEIVALAPAGLHIMLIEIYEPLITGQAIQLTLIYESGVEQVVAVPVRDITGDTWQTHEHNH